MADDQVKYKDLFDEGIIGEVQRLTNEITALKDAIAAAKAEANGLRDNLRGAGTATREQQQQTAADAAAVEALNRQVKDLTDKLAKLEERKKRYSKLTDAETASVEALRQALAGSAQDQIKATQAIDMQSKSYNELYQTYNALKDALNRMTVAERENSQAGKEMVNRAKEIRDTLNNLQQATGNYTLNVGNYMSALNGLQFQTQQVLREIPSAQNLSQFFLAISNNIPMFTDALARYNKGLPEIREKLAAVTAEIAKQQALMAGMNSQSAEYAAKQAQINELQRQQQQLQGTSVSGWRAVLKAVGSWQTLLIAGLLLLRKIPDIVKKISERFKAMNKNVSDSINYYRTMRQAVAQINSEVEQKTASVRSELALINEEMSRVNRGSTDWVGIVKRVNELTHSNLDEIKATPAEIKKVTDAYLEQQRQIEINKRIVAADVQNELNRQGIGSMFDSNLTPGEREGYFTWKDDKNKNEFKELIERYDKANIAYQRAYSTFAQMDAQMKANLEEFTRTLDKQYGERLDRSDGSNASIRAITEWRDKQLADYLNSLSNTLSWDVFGIREAFGAGAPTNTTANLRNMAKNESWDKKLELVGLKQEIEEFVKANTENYSDAYMSRLRGMFRSVNQRNKTERDTSKQEANAEERRTDALRERQQKTQEMLVELMQEGFEKQRKQEEVRHTTALQDIEDEAEKYKDEAVKQEAIDAEVATHKKKMGDIAEQEALRLFEFEQKTNKAIFEQDLHTAREKATFEKQQAIELAEFRLRIAENSPNYRKEDVETMRQELLKLRFELSNINVKYDEEEFKKRQEVEKRQFELTKHTAIEEKKFVMQQQLEFLKWRIDHAAALGISKDMLEVMKREYDEMFKQFQAGNYSTGQKNIRGSASNIIDLIFPDWDADKKRALNSVFDQAKEALNSWMDARKAAADQAKELADDEVSAAENALNREIELRNQGYANNVALRERELADAKEKQKQAVEEQKKIAQQQILLDAALQTSSLITASANILKQFAAQPLLAASLLGLMWGSFGYAKIKAYQASTKSIQFREGGVMLLNGGSHESGHDVNLGIGPDGSNLRAEGGEYFAVINKRNSRKYGSEIPAVVNALNSGMFEDRYIKTSDAVGLMGSMGRMGNMGEAVDLSAVESGVGELVKQGESKWTVEGEYRVERYKNRVRRVKIG